MPAESPTEELCASSMRQGALWALLLCVVAAATPNDDEAFVVNLRHAPGGRLLLHSQLAQEVPASSMLGLLGGHRSYTHNNTTAANDSCHKSTQPSPRSRFPDISVKP